MRRIVVDHVRHQRKLRANEATCYESAVEEMKALGNRWSFLILGLLVGAYIGGDLALRWANFAKMKYDQALEDHYINSRIWSIQTSTSTIAKAEKGKVEGIVSWHQMMLRDAFLTLVELHKTGHYKRQDADIRRFLKRAKKFMAERPKGFLEQEFFAMSSLIDRFNNPNMTTDPESTKATKQARRLLHEAFDYVDALAAPPEETNTLQVSGGER